MNNTQGEDSEYSRDVKEAINTINVLRAAIIQTLDDNSYLADGEDCTLSVLKRALRDVEMPWEGEKEDK